MVKYIFLTLVFSCIEVLLIPSFLMADNISLKGPGKDAVLTVEEKPEEPESEPAPKNYATSAPKSSTPPPAANYNVSYYIGSVEEYQNTALNLSYSGLYKYNKMIYGHNSWNLLGSLSSRYVGETFTITEGGLARQYIVTAVQTYQKTADGYLNGNAFLMNQIADTALGNDIALFTCAGTSYGNGDASHRLVVFADAI